MAKTAVHFSDGRRLFVDAALLKRDKYLFLQDGQITDKPDTERSFTPIRIAVKSGVFDLVDEVGIIGAENGKSAYIHALSEDHMFAGSTDLGYASADFHPDWLGFVELDEVRDILGLEVPESICIPAWKNRDPYDWGTENRCIPSGGVPEITEGYGTPEGGNAGSFRIRALLNGHPYKYTYHRGGGIGNRQIFDGAKLRVEAL